MADRAQLDLVLLESMAGRIRGAGNMLGVPGRSRPGPRGDGEATPIFAELLAQFSGSAAHLATGLSDYAARHSAAGCTADGPC
ncbi:hypothetical protein [Actinoplanes sp. GCM10030250]|uniref:hypothetical protein n=1 Tax=Actinoplanes sp. GCM10030250 TaxID=3273376 RepID=UPI00360D843D